MNHAKRIRYTPVAVLLMLLVACNGGSSGGGGNTGTDTTPPTVNATTPADTDTGVLINTTVTATFSEPVDCATLTTTSFSLNSGGSVTGSVTCSGATATFTPAASLALATMYTATLTTDVRDVAGNAMAANVVWSFTTETSAKAWRAPVLLDQLAAAASSPAVAASQNANQNVADVVTAAWVQSDGSQESIYSSRLVNGAWTAPQLVEHQSTGGFSGGAYDTQVAARFGGNAWVAWGYSGGSNVYRLWANDYFSDPSIGWETEQEISVSSGNVSSPPSLSFDASGNNLFMVWSQYQFGVNRSNYHILQRQFHYCDVSQGACAPPPYASGASYWGEVRRIDDLNQDGDAGEPQVATWGTGKAVAVWTHNFGINQIWANVASGGGYSDSTWGTAVRVNTGSTNSAAAPVVAVDTQGNALAVWMEFATRKALYASRYTASSGTWSSPIVIDDPAGGDAGGFQPARQKVAMDANGNAIIVWSQWNAANTLQSIRARYCPGAVPANCTAPQAIGGGTSTADYPDLSLAPNGDAIAVWKQYDDSAGTESIRANHFVVATQSWGTTTATVASGLSLSRWDWPRIAVDGQGRGTVVWSQYESNNDQNIYAARYE